MRDTVTTIIPSHPKYLSILRAVTARVGEMNGLDSSLIEDIKLAVDEACSNVIKHAYSGDTGKRIVVKFRVTDREFMVQIEDSGLKADPGSVRGRKLSHVRPGGLGVHFIKRVFDTFAFDEKKKSGNRLKLIKNLR